MEIKKELNPKDFELGVLIGRFQVHKLHEGHKKLIEQVCNNHKKVIIFLGVPIVGNSKNNPLDFATRKAMIQESYPNTIVLPQKDCRTDQKWSESLDSQIKIPFGDLSAVLYGSRDSFITHYTGKYKVIELVTDVYYSGTEVRKEVSREILSSEDFRAGIIHATYSQRPVTYPTVDIVAYNEKNQILLAKKPNEKLFRFIGGFVDRTDENWEIAARREFLEETGGSEIGELKYISSSQINDWRYSKSESGIMTSLFLGKFLWGPIQPSDDIEFLKWFNIQELDTKEKVDNLIMPEHKKLMNILITKIINNETDIKLNEHSK